MSAVNGNGKPRPRRRGARTNTDDLTMVREANKLRLRGVEWDTIAGLTGYASAGTARMAVENWRRLAANEQSIDERREALREAVEAYNHFIDKWWDKAESDLAALTALMRVMAQRDRIKGLDKTREDTGTGSVLVIGGTEDQYLAGLDQVINDPN